MRYKRDSSFLSSKQKKNRTSSQRSLREFLKLVTKKNLLLSGFLLRRNDNKHLFSFPSFSIPFPLGRIGWAALLLILTTTFGKAFNNAAAAFTYKGYNFIPFVSSGKFFFYKIKCLRCVHAFIVNNAINVQYLVNTV